MKRNIFTLILILLIHFYLFSDQTDDQKSIINSLIQDGIALHDSGNYSEAINKYNEVLKIDEKNELALYEIVFSHMVVKDYDISLKYCDIGIALQGQYLGSFYMIKGNILDDLNKPEEALVIYQEALSIIPDHYLLHYNLGLTHSDLGNIDAAIEGFQRAISLNNKHTSSYYALATTYNKEEKYIFTLLLYFNFLLLEPETWRSTEVITQLSILLNRNVDVETNTIVMASNDGDYYNAMTIVLAGDLLLNSNKDLNKYDILKSQLSLLISIFVELGTDDLEDDFIVRQIYPLFKNIYDEENIDAAVNYALRSIAVVIE